MGGAYRSNYTRKAFRNLYNNLYGLKRVCMFGRKLMAMIYNCLLYFSTSDINYHVFFSPPAAKSSKAFRNGGEVC